jgi:two-component system CheB/CheR fusion protein
MDSKSPPGPDDPAQFFPIVGIGASVGGLEALDRFLSALPDEGFGFAVVFMQHFSPKHTSLLPGLLRSKKPNIEIAEVSDGLQIRPGKVYLCTSAEKVSVEKGAFRVSARDNGHVHLSIDEFFTSLAEDAGQRAIAAVFSGAGTDGARGVQTVRAAGGTVFVQDPAMADHTEMPLAAINTGKMDGVLSPEEIAREIVKLHSSGMVTVPADRIIATAQLEHFYKLLHEKTGNRFNHYKKTVIGRRIRRRMYLHGIASVSEYLEMVATKETEAALLAADLMIGVTSFFRDRLAWKALHLEATRKLAAQESDSPIRVWCPACATGEEAYSIAMMLRSELDLAGKRREIQVFATDVNDRALEQAREGVYPASISADVPPDYMRKFFVQSEDGLTVNIDKEIRGHVVFAKQDLLSDPPFSRMDLIICRNLLIYLEPDAQEKCIALFHYALKDGGFLFLGAAESPGRNNLLFTVLAHKKCRVYRKNDARQPLKMPAIPFGSERVQSPPAKQAAPPEYRQPTIGRIQEALLDQYGPAAVAINQNYDILYHNGPTRRYLTQPRGTPTQNLLALLPGNLARRLRGALYRAGHETKPVSIRTTIPADDGRTRHLTITVTRVQENLFLLAFTEKGAPFQAGEGIYLESDAAEETAVRQLEHELSATREDLQGHIEQFRSLNEELQSSNEELQAANEELETSREELQSLNEELTTVNVQLQAKIEEEEGTSNDLNNFLTSTNIPTIFLDDRFRVKRFTPAMSKLVKLLPGDVGRPIVDMSQEHLGHDLLADARSVLDNLAPVRKEIAINGAWYVRTTLPYRTADNRIEGVVVTYADFTELKTAEGALRESQKQLAIRAAELEAVNRDLEAFSYTVSNDLKTPLRSIQGFAQAISDDCRDKLDDEGRDFLLRITSAVQRMTELIDSMLTMSRLTGRDLISGSVNLSSLAEVVAHELTTNEPDRRVELVVAKDAHVRGIPTCLRWY